METAQKGKIPPSVTASLLGTATQGSREGRGCGTLLEWSAVGVGAPWAPRAVTVFVVGAAEPPPPSLPAQIHPEQRTIDKGPVTSPPATPAQKAGPSAHPVQAPGRGAALLQLLHRGDAPKPEAKPQLPVTPRRSGCSQRSRAKAAVLPGLARRGVRGAGLPVSDNNPFNHAHNYSFAPACWPLSKIVLPFFFFLSFPLSPPPFVSQ